MGNAIPNLRQVFNDVTIGNFNSPCICCSPIVLPPIVLHSGDWNCMQCNEKINFITPNKSQLEQFQEIKKCFSCLRLEEAIRRYPQPAQVSEVIIPREVLIEHNNRLNHRSSHIPNLRYLVNDLNDPDIDDFHLTRSNEPRQPSQEQIDTIDRVSVKTKKRRFVLKFYKPKA